MPDFKTLKELEDFVRVAIKKSLQTEVLETVKKVESSHVDSDVYAKYPHPKMYKRRESGGLGNIENIHGVMITDDTLSVTNDTPAYPYGVPQSQVTIDGKNLSLLVEEGDGASGFYDFSSEEDESYKEARPFTEGTINDLASSGAHKKALQSGLKRQGINSN